LAEADGALERVKLGCDLIIGARLLDLKPKEKEARLNTLLLAYMAGKLDTFLVSGHSEARRAEESPSCKTETLRSAQGDIPNAEAQAALDAARKMRAFHWPFEFPEIFATGGTGGFSAFVGNPPFLGGLRISTMLSDHYLRYLREAYPSSTGTADLCAFFFLRAFDELRPNGTFGLIATNTIAQGDTREAGLDFIVKRGGTIYAAESSAPWPGVAAVYVSVIHAIKGSYDGSKSLDGISVMAISSLLDSTSILGHPKMLAQNSGKSFIGEFVLGMGFVLQSEEAHALIAKDPKNTEVVFPYLNGEDLNSQPDQTPAAGSSTSLIGR
jgi:hypothetical protein